MRGWSAKVKLSRTDIATIVDALAELRDRDGSGPDDLEVRLSDLLHRGDREMGEAVEAFGPEALR